jgi:hypothetical protein
VFNILDKDEPATQIHVALRKRAQRQEELPRIGVHLVASMDNLGHLLPQKHDAYVTWHEENWGNEDIDVSNLHVIREIGALVARVSLTRYLTCNFLPIENKRGTIQFRRPYQSLGYRHAAHGVAFTLRLCSFFFFSLRKKLENALTDHEAFKRNFEQM